MFKSHDSDSEIKVIEFKESVKMVVFLERGAMANAYSMAVSSADVISVSRLVLFYVFKAELGLKKMPQPWMDLEGFTDTDEPSVQIGTLSLFHV